VYVLPRGALTSSIYAYEGRKWELQSIDSCDIHDPSLNTIRVEVSGLRTLRISPKLRQGLNEEWLSNRIRYSFDGIYSKRLSQPLLRTREDDYHILGWHTVLTKSTHKLEKYERKWIYTPSGETDGETLSMAREARAKRGYVRYARDRDLRTSYISESLHMYTLGYSPSLNVNLRREYPVVDFLISEKLRYAKLGVWREQYNIPRASGMGNGLREILRVIGGRSRICRLLERSSSISVAIYSEETNFVLPSLLESLRGQVALATVAVLRTSGYTIQSDLGGINCSPRSDIIYNMGEDESDYMNGVYLIYQGHSGDRAIKMSNLILPSTQFIEREGLYMNLLGEVQCTRFIFEPPGISRTDWRILGGLANVAISKMKRDLHNLSMVRLRMCDVSPSVFTKRYLSEIPRIIHCEDSGPVKLVNHSLSEFIVTPYKDGTTTRVSKTLKTLGEKDSNTYYRPEG
jgi:hypothetical protein